MSEGGQYNQLNDQLAQKEDFKQQNNFSEIQSIKSTKTYNTSSQQSIFHTNNNKEPQFIGNFDLETQAQQNNLQISGINLIGCDLLRKETFHFQVVDKLQKLNPAYGLLQILLDQRIVVVKKGFQYLRNTGLLILIGGFILFLIMSILYASMFSQYIKISIASQLFIIISLILWFLTQFLIYVSLRRFRIKEILYSQIIIGIVALISFIIFCIEAKNIGIGYILMIVIQIISQTIQIYLLSRIKIEMEQIQHLLD